MAKASDSDSDTPGRGGASEPSRAQVKARVAFERARRARLGVPAVAGGVLYLLSGIILNATFKGIPTVGVLQGVAPALRGEPNPPVSPRAAEVKFQSHHAVELIAGSLLVALAYAAIVVVLLFVFDSARMRRPQTGGVARWLILIGGSGVATLSVVTQVLLAIKTHEFATGHDFSAHAVEAVTHNGFYTTLAYLTPLAGIALAAGMIMTMLAGSRVGLLPRWVAMVGGVSAVLLLLPTTYLDIPPAFWMVAMGILLMERWPSGDPPAWASGEAIPWPSQMELREQKEAAKGARPGKGARGRPAGATAGEDVAPDPLGPGGSAGQGSARKRRRKRSASR